MRKFDYNQLVDQVSKIEIRLEGDEVATYYDGKEKARKPVSTKYEIFDFRPFVIQCINEVMNQYNIEYYTLQLVGGRQEIRLFSEEEVVKGERFRRTFYLLNSSDKSRALSFSYGLQHNGFHYVSKKGTIYKKHYTGITEYVNERVDLDDTIFQEQLEIVSKLIDDTIYMSDVQNIILDGKTMSEARVGQKNNFENFKNRLYYNTNGILSDNDRNKLYVNWNRRISVDFSKKENDFMVDSFLVFKTYLEIFKNRDASEIKRESERIAKMSVMENRTSFLDELLETL